MAVASENQEELVQYEHARMAVSGWRTAALVQGF